MVLSKINKEVSYKDTKKIEEDDIEHASPIYSIFLHLPSFQENVSSPPLKNIAIVLGKPKFSFAESKGVVYYPIYLLSKQKVHSQIGVFETNSFNLPSQATAILASPSQATEKPSNLPSRATEKASNKESPGQNNILDEEGDVDLSKLDDPILYDFVTSDFIKEVDSNPKDYVMNNDDEEGTELKKSLVPSETISAKPKETLDVADDDNEDEEENDNMDVFKLKIQKKQKPPAKNKPKNC